jgi:hypothetical protein
VFPRLWSVAHKHGYITSADFVRGRSATAGCAGDRVHQHPGDHAVLQRYNSGIQVVSARWARTTEARHSADQTLISVSPTSGLRAPKFAT